MNSWNEIDKFRRIFGETTKYDHLIPQVRKFSEETAHKEYLRGRREAVEYILARFPTEDTADNWRQFTQVWKPNEIVKNALQAALEEKVTD